MACRGNDPNPTTEVTLEQFLEAGQLATETNPGFRSADVTLKLTEEDKNYNITAQYAKEAEGDDWELFTELSAGEENRPYSFALEFLPIHPQHMGYITQQYSNSKFYHDASGFKYVGSMQTEYNGAQYESNLLVLFNAYGYCVKVKQDQKVSGKVYFDIDFHATYSTNALGGGSNPITDEVTKEQFITAAEQAIKVEPGYKSAKIRYVLSGVDLYGNISLSANYSRDIQTGKWKYHSGDSSLTFDYMISMYLETRLDRDTVGEQTSYQDIHFYMDNSGFRLTFKSKTSIDGENYIDIVNEAIWDKYGFMTLYEVKPVDASSTNYHHLFTAKYSTNSLTGGDNPMTEIEGDRISESEWEDYCDSVAMVNSEYKSAVLFGTYETKTDLNGQSSGSGTAAKLYFANTMGGKTTWVFHHSEGTESLVDFFDDLIFTTPGYFLSASLNVIFSRTRDAYIATVIGSGYYSVGRFDPSTGYIVSAKTIIDIGNSNESKFEILNCTITYSKDELEGGEQQADEMSAAEWKEYAERVASVNKGYKSAILVGRLTSNAGNPDYAGNGAEVQLYYENKTNQKRNWSLHHYQGTESIISFFDDFIIDSPSSYIDLNEPTMTFTNEDDSAYIVHIVTKSYEVTVTFDADGYIASKSVTYDEGEGKSTTLIASMVYSEEPLPGGGGGENPGTMTYEQWTEYAAKAEQMNPGYKSAYLDATRTINKEQEKISAVYSSENGKRDEWTIHSYEGDNSLLNAAESMMETTPSNILPDDMESFKGTFTFISSEKVFKAVKEDGGVTTTYVFNEYGMLTNIVGSAEGISFNGNIKYSTDPVSAGGGEGGGEDEGYDETARQLGENEYMFIQGGEPELSWTIDESLMMYSSTIAAVSIYSTDIADKLQADKDNIDFIYSKQVTLGTDKATWNSPIVIGYYKYMVNGSLTVKARTGIKTGEGTYEHSEWYPGPGTNRMENLSPNTLFMPGWYSDADAYGISWGDNPTAYEPGIYAFIVVGYGESDEGYAGGMALVKLSDYDESPIGEPTFEQGYGLFIEEREMAPLTLNPGNPKELMASKVTVRGGQEVNIKDLVKESYLTMANLDAASTGFKIEDGKLICTEAGTYDFYVIISNGGISKIYIGPTSR